MMAMPPPIPDASTNSGSAQTLKRPASHRWVIGVLGLFTIMFFYAAIRFVLDNDTLPMRTWKILLIPGYCTAAFFLILFGKQRRWVYYVISVFLALLAMRPFYIAASYAYYYFIKKTRIYLELDQLILMPIFGGLLIALFLWFTINRKSRSYYGFVDSQT